MRAARGRRRVAPWGGRAVTQARPQAVVSPVSARGANHLGGTSGDRRARASSFGKACAGEGGGDLLGIDLVELVPVSRACRPRAPVLGVIGMLHVLVD